jgi:hypothetical protein
MTARSFVERAEEALRTGQAAGDVRVLASGPPPVLDAVGRKALVAPLLAAFMWAAVVFRATLEQQARSGLDPLGLIFRVLALALTVRTVLLGVELWPRLRAWLDMRRYALVLTDDGLLLRTPVADFPVAKDDIIDIQEHGAWGDHSGRRWAHVYLITRPDSGRFYLALPPLFEATPGVLAERLMRWRGPRPEPRAAGQAPGEQAPGAKESAPLPSKLFDQAAAGESLPGSVVIKHGNAYLRRGPYATVLLGLAVLTDWAALPDSARVHGNMLAPMVMGFSLLAVPAIWFLTMRNDLKPRKGIALVLTPAEMLMRTRAGVHRVAWTEVQKLEITSRTGWSVLLGPHPQRTLIVRRKPSKAAPDDDNTITYVEEFLGAPAEVVVSLCDGYRKGILP